MATKEPNQKRQPTQAQLAKWEKQRGKPSVKVIDLTGQRFGRLTVTRRDTDKPAGTAWWICICDCGETTSVRGYLMRNGTTQSCGCLVRETVSKRRYKHGLTGTRVYRIWHHMHRRCYDPKHISYPLYGERGITVCERWHNFENFLADMGEPPTGYSIERVNNDLGYSPDNCIWASGETQANNTRSNHRITYNGETRTLMEWSRIYGINRATLWARICVYGWPVEKALTANNRNARDITYNGETRTIAEWARIRGIHRTVLYKRLFALNWPIGKALGLE